MVVLRTPLLAFDVYRDWTARPQRGVSSGGAGPRTSGLDAERARLRRGLRLIAARPPVREALSLALPGHEAELDRWISGEKDETGMEPAALRLLLRMMSWPTPDGLLAGTSIGRIGERTRLRLLGSEGWRRHSRLDFEYLLLLSEEAAQDPDVENEIVFRPNSSLYKLGDRLRYVETRREDGRRTHQLVSVASDELLERTLERARTGARLADLADGLLADDPEIERAEAVVFLGDMVDLQLLVADLTPPLTGEEPLAGLIERLAAVAPARSLARRLDDVRRKLHELDRQGLGAPPRRYREIARRLEDGGAPLGPRWIDAELIKPGDDVVVGHDVIGELARGLRLLNRLMPEDQLTPKLLESFRRAFSERYGEGVARPLAETLDPDEGLLPEGFHVDDDPERPRTPRGRYLRRKIDEALEGGEIEVTVDAEELTAAGLATPATPLPDAFAVLAEIGAAGPEALERGEIEIVFRGSAGPSGARHLGRLAQLEGDFARAVEAHLRAEEAAYRDTGDGEAVFAEVVHLPAGPFADASCRAVLRAWEIPYLGSSGAPRERQLPLEDLRVTVAGGEIRLLSRRLGKRVIPRLTSGDNFFASSLPVYRFLGLLQNQDTVAGLGWKWRRFEELPFLPRVRSGRLVLCRARWRVERREVRALAETDGEDRRRTLAAWRAERRLPRFAFLVEGSRHVLVDFDNVLTVDLFLEHLDERGFAALWELYPKPEQLCATGPEGRFVHEVLVPFLTGQ